MSVAISLLSFLSCTKSDSDINDSVVNAQLQFSVSGITEINPIGNSEKKGDNNASRFLVKHEKFEHFETTNYYTNDNLKSGLGKKTAAIAMEVGVRYRVEIYEKSGSIEKHWRTINLVANTMVSLADTIGVVYGKTYKWYAYSYNTNAVITVPEKSLEVDMSVNKDFLYASNELTISQYGNTGINILFKRKTARIAIDLDGRGSMANAITALQVVFPAGLLKTGNFNLKDEQVVASSLTNLSVADCTIDLNEFQNVYNPETYRKRFYLYSVSTVANQPILNLTVNSFTINVDNGLTTGNSTANRNFTDSGALTFSYSNIAMAIGSSGSLKVDILESGLTYSGTTWARSNLYRHSATGFHRYRFFPQNLQTNDTRSYFSFKGYIPLTLTERSASKDPCALVYPAGRWMTPMKVNFSSITSSEGILSNTVSGLLSVLFPVSTTNTDPIVGPNNNTGNYIRYTGTTTSSGNNLLFAENSRYLQFPMNGFHMVSDLLTIGGVTLVNLNLGDTYGNNAAFWTYEEGVNLIGLAGLGAWGYLGRIRKIIVPVSRAYSTASPISEVNLLPPLVNVLSTDFKNIRCIRNSSWEAASALPGYEPEPNY